MRTTSSQVASGVTIFQEARLSSAVPHSTAFLPPAFMAMLPPMQLASALVGSTAKHKAVLLGQVGHALGDDAGFARWWRPRGPGPAAAASRRPARLRAFGVDDGAVPHQGTAPPV